MAVCYRDFTTEEKIALWQQCKNGDENARENLINSNCSLVGAIAVKLSPVNDEYNELFQSGVLGLIKAVDGFDYTVGTAFSTYALPFIHGEILRQKERSRGIKRQRNSEILLAKIRQAESCFEVKYSRSPSISEVAVEIGETVENIIWITENYREDISLNDINIIDDKSTNVYETVEDKVFLRELLQEVTVKERTILLEHYIKGNTQGVIAKKLNLSQTQISRLEKSALEKLKKISQL